MVVSACWFGSVGRSLFSLKRKRETNPRPTHTTILTHTFHRVSFIIEKLFHNNCVPNLRMEAIVALGNYGASDSEDSDSGINENALIKQPEHLKYVPSTKMSMEIVAAPTVITKYDVAGARHVDVSQGTYLCG